VNQRSRPIRAHGGDSAVRRTIAGGALSCVLILAASPASGGGAAHLLLFTGAGDALSESDQRAVTQALGLGVTPDGRALVIAWLDCPAIQVQVVDVRDLDEDGSPEVIVLAGNACTSGGLGSTLWLLTRNPTGTWTRHLGFPAGGYELLPKQGHGLPDIRIAGMGGRYALLYWDGATYRHRENIPVRPGACPASATSLRPRY
jgi:hypothetical protein